MPVAYCPNCGCLNAPDAQPCVACRERLPDPRAVAQTHLLCPHCRRPTWPNSRYCVACGSGQPPPPHPSSSRRAPPIADDLAPPIRPMMLNAFIPFFFWELAAAGVRVANHGEPLLLLSLPWLVYGVLLGYYFAWQGIPHWLEATRTGMLVGLAIGTASFIAVALLWPLDPRAPGATLLESLIPSPAFTMLWVPCGGFKGVVLTLLAARACQLARARRPQPRH